MGRLKRMYMLCLVALVVMAMTATAAFAYTINENGEGFVGKGEVQTALGLNNSQLQNGKFVFNSEVVTEQSWECTNPNNEKIQQREITTTTTGLVSSTERLKNQITGFNLHGFGDSTSTTEGNKLNSCPDKWELTSPAGAPVMMSSTLTVNGAAL